MEKSNGKWPETAEFGSKDCWSQDLKFDLLVGGFLSLSSVSKKTVMSCIRRQQRLLLMVWHHIQIVGWPEGVKFKSPSDISSTEDLHALYNALSKWEIEEFKKELAQREKKKTWKICKDKSMKQRCNVNGEDDGEDNSEDSN
ncbi:hypothetical protein EV421DRAFT_1733122 [Armillaria borealis]|uniref:Uncharacterized protein n=1 Tax=Armillaria borealis TaxID=47425 RepID=A0AA39MVP8_9AGAR|nr:hypothetical protein EV421DRAFT_1733122 [Armillaria borealis]